MAFLGVLSALTATPTHPNFGMAPNDGGKKRTDGEISFASLYWQQSIPESRNNVPT